MNITFRGFRKDGKGWVEGDKFEGNNGIYILQKKMPHYEIHPESLGFSIGHTDKNCKEIFIGDLHKDIDGDILKVIQMDCGRYALQMLGNNYIDEFVDWNYIEIIGNQYEQPQQ